MPMLRVSSCAPAESAPAPAHGRALACGATMNAVPKQIRVMPARRASVTAVRAFADRRITTRLLSGRWSWVEQLAKAADFRLAVGGEAGAEEPAEHRPEPGGCMELFAGYDARPCTIRLAADAAA